MLCHLAGLRCTGWIIYRITCCLFKIYDKHSFADRMRVESPSGRGWWKSAGVLAGIRQFRDEAVAAVDPMVYLSNDTYANLQDGL